MCAQSPTNFDLPSIQRDNGKFDISTTGNGGDDDDGLESPVFSLLETVQIQKKKL